MGSPTQWVDRSVPATGKCGKTRTCIGLESDVAGTMPNVPQARYPRHQSHHCEVVFLPSVGSIPSQVRLAARRREARRTVPCRTRDHAQHPLIRQARHAHWFPQPVRESVEF